MRKIELFFARDTMARLYKVKRTAARPGLEVLYDSPVRTSTERTTRALTLTEAAVLALLSIEGEASGYDLLKQARKSIGHVWTPAKTQLYALLPRFVRDGLATQRVVAQAARPDKQLYRTTSAGRAALQLWLDTPEPGARDAFFLRLFVGRLADPESLIAHVEQFRADVEEKLNVLREIEPTNTRRGHDAYHWFLLELGIDEAELELRWADKVLRSLKRRHH
jgi:DNA-binding PadR family transcriptional regulator